MKSKAASGEGRFAYEGLDRVIHGVRQLGRHEVRGAHEVRERGVRREATYDRRDLIWFTDDVDIGPGCQLAGTAHRCAAVSLTSGWRRRWR